MVTADMLISDIIDLIPEAEDILAHYQLGCGSCSMNTYETLGDGLRAHGYGATEVMSLLNDLNNRATDYSTEIEAKGVYITPFAIEKIDYFATELDKIGYGISVIRTQDEHNVINYAMDFQEKALDDEMTISYKDQVNIFIKQDDEEILKGLMVDFVDNYQGTGFKISNPNDSQI